MMLIGTPTFSTFVDLSFPGLPWVQDINITAGSMEYSPQKAISVRYGDSRYRSTRRSRISTMTQLAPM